LETQELGSGGYIKISAHNHSQLSLLQSHKGTLIFFLSCSS